MKTSELIDETRAILDDNSSAVSGDPDELWSKERILRRLTKAQEIFCRRGWVLHDSMTAVDANSLPVCSLSLVAETADYHLSPLILKVLSARLSDTDQPMGQRNWNQIYQGPAPINQEFFDVNRQAVFDSGRPELFATDPMTGYITFWRKPNADSALLTVKMRVVRMPLAKLTLETNNSPEIAEQYHLDLTTYAAGTLLARTANNDASARAHGRELRSDFYEEVEEARSDVKRMMLSAPRFIFGGWSAE